VNPPNDPIAPCPITVDGRRATLRAPSATDTIGDLAVALGLDPGTGLWIDGVGADPAVTLVAAGVRVGAAVSTHAPPCTAVAEPSAAVAVATVVAGPAAGAAWRLPPGRHRVGRAPASEIHLDDPAVELHHGFLDLAAGGEAWFHQLTGRIPVHVDDRPCARAAPVGADIRIGSSRISITPIDDAPGRGGSGAGCIVDADRDPWRRAVRREPTPPPPADPKPIPPPLPEAEHAGPPLIGLVGAAVAAAGAGLLAAVIGQPLFALFGAVGVLASAATWAFGALTTRRARRTASATRAAELERFLTALAAARATAERRHRCDHPTLAEVLGRLDAEQRVWERRAGADAPLRATVGVGVHRANAPVDDRTSLDAELLMAVEHSEVIDDVGVPIELPAGRIVAVHGDPEPATAVVRAVVAQLAVHSGPADWRLVVVTDRSDEWSWTDWIPHAVAGSPVVRAVGDALGDLRVDDHHQLVVVTDAPGALASRTGPLRRLLDTTGAAAIVVTSPAQPVPTVCSAVLDVGAHFRGRWRHHRELGEPAIHLAGLTRTDAEAVGRRLAPLLDPEDPDGAASGAPDALRLGELLGPVDGSTIADTWRRGGSDPAPTGTIGRSGDGWVAVDLVRDGPHALIAGTTGAGKSELLRTLVAALAVEVGPDHLTFVLVDFKGGATFDACARLPHCVGVVTDLDDGLAERAIVSLDAEIRRRERLLRDVRADDLTGYRRNATEPLPRLVVVVDEFATLAKELPDVLTALIGIAQRGRSLGIHLVLATQRPAGVVTDDIRANTNLRLALRVHDRSDANDVVGDDLPATIPRSLPGRAALRLGPDELVVFQAASCTGAHHPHHDGVVVDFADTPADNEAPSGTELDVLVDAIGDAALLAGCSAPRRPWLDPLPRRLDRRRLEAEVGRCDATIGMIDDPAAQARRPLQWRRDAGNLLVVGALGSGATTTAVSAVASRLRSRSPDDVHLYVVDGRGDPGLDALAEVAHCAAVVRVTEVERLDRMLRRLTTELDRRSLNGDRTPEVLLVVDGIESVRNAVAAVERAESAAMLQRIVQDGAPSGMLTCATTDGSSAAVLATVTGERWVHHVDEASIARAAGLRTAPPPRVPGRLRVVESGLAAQVVADDQLLDGLPGRTPGCGPEPVVELPAVVDPDDLPAGDGDGLVVGLAADDLLPTALCVPAGDHVFVGGAAGTGKTTTLHRLVAAWRATHPNGRVVAVDRQRPLATDAVGGDAGPMLVVVDDADRVDDADGRLAAIVTGRLPGLTVVAAARVEAVRSAYGHWVRDVARSRCGLIMTGPGDVDGELLGATLPRRSIIPARPGLAWMIDRRGHRLVQVAARMPP
jgi:DNA segregation ATPase FtsK/SpoIIIE, S-DNA-T family